MSDFQNSHLGKIRQLVGSQLLLVPGARVVIEGDEGKILLQHRSDLGLWGLPGGNAEPEEDISALLQREVEEETGLVICNVTPFGFGSNPQLETIAFPNGDLCQFFVLNFFTKSFAGTPKISDEESLALDWFPRNGLPEMLPNMLASLKAYERFSLDREFQMF